MGKIVTKLYLYDASKESDGFRGLDYSDYILQGDTSVEDLTDVLDTLTLTLVGLPFSKEFSPDTKFIYEKYDVYVDAEGNETLSMWGDEAWHICVAQDVVEQPIISDNAYFNHHITFYEASVDAQKRVVENISITYKLKDVDLNVAPTYDENATIPISKSQIDFVSGNGYGYSEPRPYQTVYRIGHQFRWVMPTWYTYADENGAQQLPSWEKWQATKLYQTIASTETSKRVVLPIPMLEVLYGKFNSKELVHQGYANVKVVITKTNTTTQETTQQTIIVSPNRNDANEVWTSQREYHFPKDEGLIVSRFEAYGAQFITGDAYYNRYVTKIANYVDTTENRTIDLTIENGYSYSIDIGISENEFTPERFGDAWSESETGSGVPFLDLGQLVTRVDLLPYYYFYARSAVTSGNRENYGYACTETNPQVTTKIYGVLEVNDTSIYLRSASVPTAYYLFKKAIYASQNFRQDKIYTGLPFTEIYSIYDNPYLPYYMDKNDEDLLKNTYIVECMFEQKNLWEILLEIGKYIHSVPKIRFGTDDRFLVTWKKLGDTNIREADKINNVPVSIFNSKSIEEYVSSISSYATNMVQLGGSVEEWVAPKSSSEDYLVYNDVAQIKMSKSMIEILQTKVKFVGDLTGGGDNCINEAYLGQDRDMTEHVYEKNVYKVLPITANSSVNKGLAVYYELGTNVIQGLNYQLPTVNTGDADSEYAIKRIIAKLFGITDAATIRGIKINQFIFYVKYRTKDSVLVEQARPDLRKFLSSSQYDIFPQFKQFSNQTDVVADSVKFSQNIYGQLIRTGNTNYTCMEWNNAAYSVKRIGELYRIRGDLYYVAKVSTVWFCDHCVSEVEYSKDYNKLSQIIGIPSEPRFYEISEQSYIDREKSLPVYYMIGDFTDEVNSLDFGDKIAFLSGYTAAKIMFGTQEKPEQVVPMPKYAITCFKSDPSTDNGLGTTNWRKTVLSPVNVMSGRTLTISWDMADNFSAGDQIQPTALPASSEPERAVDTAYSILLPYQYCDIFGRAELFDCIITSKSDLTAKQVIKLPEAPFSSVSSSQFIFGTTGSSVISKTGQVLIKDNREVIHFNINVQLLTASDRFIVSSYAWQFGKTNLKLALLTEEVNKISNATISTNIIKEIVDFELQELVDEENPLRKNTLIKINEAIGAKDLSDVKAIAIINNSVVLDEVGQNARYFVVAKNVSDLSQEDKARDWVFFAKPLSYEPSQGADFAEKNGYSI